MARKRWRKRRSILWLRPKISRAPKRILRRRPNCREPRSQNFRSVSQRAISTITATEPVVAHEWLAFHRGNKWISRGRAGRFRGPWPVGPDRCACAADIRNGWALSHVPCARDRTCSALPAGCRCFAGLLGGRFLSGRHRAFLGLALSLRPDGLSSSGLRHTFRWIGVPGRLGDIRLDCDKGFRMTLNQDASETVLVAGAGIAGLGAALALSDGKRRVTILDRDPPPPDASPEEAFRTWERRGATQLRHSHAFLGRLTTLIRKRYPQLMEELLAAGARLFTYEDGLTPALRELYVQEPGD